jgi:hypothetical protein
VRAHTIKPCPSDVAILGFVTILLNKNRRDIGKSQSQWTAYKMETLAHERAEVIVPQEEEAHCGGAQCVTLRRVLQLDRARACHKQSQWSAFVS